MLVVPLALVGRSWWVFVMDRHCYLQVAILNANYMAARLDGHYVVLFRGTQGK